MQRLEAALGSARLARGHRPSIAQDGNTLTAAAESTRVAIVGWDRDSSPRDLVRAIDELDTRRVAELCGELIDHVEQQDDPYPVRPAGTIVGALRGGRHFAHVQRVADALLRTGVDDAAIRRHHAQALIDQGRLVAAEVVLQRLVADTGEAEAEHMEALGLLGRTYKQMYLADGAGAPNRRRDHLQRAVATYDEVHRATGSRWHAINVVALLSRADREGLAIEGVEDAAAAAALIAKQILADIEAMAEVGTWDAATAMEACVALGRDENALQWLDDYLVKADAFGIAAALRQLHEVWQLAPDTDPGQQLIPLLQSALLRAEGPADVRLGAADIAPAGTPPLARDPGFQKVLGSERFESLRWFETALERCRAVARIEDATERPMGTGFLVAGPSLHPEFPPLVLVTNAHVISRDDPLALHPDDARVTFRALQSEPVSYRIGRLLWSSPFAALDATIIELDGYPANVAGCPVAARRPVLERDPPPQTYIIGHPSGWDQVMLSVRDNQVLDGDEKRLHYRTPTEPGSSGSPVFDHKWELIALHHAGRTSMPRLHGKPGTYPANEGIWLDCVVRAIVV